MLEISYILIYVSLIILLLIGLAKSANVKKKRKKLFYIFIGGNILWLIYLYLISFNGFVANRSLPPRFPLAVFVPVILIIIFLLKWMQKHRFYNSVPKSWPIYFQTFRVVMEQAILITAIQNIIPIEGTYKGYNYEFYFALSAPFIAYFAFKKKLLPNWFLIAWNTLGILLLVVVVTIIASAFFAPELWGYEYQGVQDKFVKMPYILLPAFMVPSAIFMHLFSIFQVTTSNKYAQ